MEEEVIYVSAFSEIRRKQTSSACNRKFLKHNEQKKKEYVILVGTGILSSKIICE